MYEEYDYTKYSDEGLVVLALESSHHYGELIRRYQNKLGSYLRRRARLTNEDVEDLLQEVFIKIYTNLNGFDPSLSFSSWAYRITHNHLVSWIRKRKVRHFEGGLEGDEEILNNIVSEIDVVTEVERGELGQYILESIKKLSPKYREILILRFYEHKDYEEISDILEIPPGTVATRLNRAKKKLAEMITVYE